MKKLFTHLMVFAITLSAFSQPPERLSFQAVVRNAGGELIKSSSVGIKVSILQNSSDGDEVYAEMHTATTNANGLVTLEIGGGTPVTGTFAAIDWSTGTYFIKTETDPSGGTNYTITGVSQILSVPYALHSKTAKTADYNDLLNKPELFSGDYNDLLIKPELFSGNYDDLTNKPELFDSSWTSITDKPTTLNGYGITDAATKAYVDDILKALGLVHENFAGTVTDIDGNIYKTVKIGDQVWMAENLKTSRCNDGEVIPCVESDLDWWSMASPAYSYYQQDIYGRLYNWYAVNTGKLCPTGWHVPDNSEWMTLVNYLGGGSIASSKLMEAGEDHWWCEGDRTATNSSGFTALPGGFRSGYDVNHAAILMVHEWGYWWISAEGSYANFKIFILLCENELRILYLKAPERGYSVRCLKD